MHIFVTGGAGYIGSICSEELINAGHQVTIFDNLTEGHRKAIDSRATFIEGDLANRDDILGAVADAKPDAVMHFAANALVGESMTNPSKYFRNNVAAGINLARRRGRGRREEVHLLLHLRHLRHAGKSADGRAAAAKADQSLRRVEADVRAGAPLVRQDPRPRHVQPALLQRRRARARNSARTTASRRTSSPTSSRSPSASRRTPKSTARNTPRPTAPASATTSTSTTSPPRTCSRSAVRRAPATTSAAAKASR